MSLAFGKVSDNYLDNDAGISLALSSTFI